MRERLKRGQVLDSDQEPAWLADLLGAMEGARAVGLSMESSVEEQWRAVDAGRVLGEAHSLLQEYNALRIAAHTVPSPVPRSSGVLRQLKSFGDVVNVQVGRRSSFRPGGSLDAVDCGKCGGTSRRGLLGMQGLGLISRDCRHCRSRRGDLHFAPRAA